MREKGRVALVTPRADRRRSALAWSSLVSDRAELLVLESAHELDPFGADVVLVDEACPDLDVYIARSLAPGERPTSIVVFGDEKESVRGALPWGTDGAEVLATLSDLLERKSLVEESDRFVEELRASTTRLEEQRRRFANLVVANAEALHSSHQVLTREVDTLRRVQSLARFFAAPGPPEGWGNRLARVLAFALDSDGATVVRRDRSGHLRVFGTWKIAARTALLAAPSGSAAPPNRRPRSPGVKSTNQMPPANLHWISLAQPEGSGVVLSGKMADDANTKLLIERCFVLLGEGLEARLAEEDARERFVASDRAIHGLRGGLLKISSAGTIALVNPAFATLLGVKPSFLQGRSAVSVFERDPHLLELFDRMAREGPPRDDVETYLTSAGGGAISVAIRASRVPEGESGKEAVLALFFDLSRRREVEAEVRRAERLAALGRLSAGVAHEIRNPLAGIRTTAEVLKSRLAVHPELVPFAEVILEESQRLDRIVGSLLQFAKPSEPRMEQVDFSALLDRALQLASGSAAEHRVHLRRSEPQGRALPLADRDQMLQVLLNLVLNGIEATPPLGAVTVTLTGPSSARGGEVVCRIEDGGDGVPRSIRDRVFDPFFTTKPGGTGLGLSISENIVRRHGGSIRLEQPEGGAHAAILTLPVKPPTAAPPMSRGGNSWPAS